MPPVQKKPAAATTKAPTLATQLKSLAGPGKGQPITVPYNQRDIEIAAYMSQIKEALKKKYKTQYGPTYKNAVKTVIDNASNVPDAVVYLQKVLKMLNPTAQVGGALPKKIKPGQFQGFGAPNLPLTPFAKQFTVAPENEAKANALAKKIADYEAEIQRLKDARQAAEFAREQAKDEREKLSGIDEKLLKYFNYIEVHCSDFLKEVRATRRLLYRGQDDATLPIFVGYPRDDRKPKDSSKEATELLDKSLKLMGFKALRSNSIFTSSDQYQADGYGELYVIFPKNGFSFTWSTEHDDLVVTSIEELTGEYNDDDTEDLYYELIDEMVSDDEWLFYKGDLDYTICQVFKLDEEKDAKQVATIASSMTKSPEFKALKKITTSFHNIDPYDTTLAKLRKTFIIYADAAEAFAKAFPKFNKYENIYSTAVKKYAERFRKEKDDPTATGKKDLETAKKIIKNYGFTHENLAAALKSEHEICILGEYVAVSHERYEEEINRFFLAPKVKATKKAPVKK